MSLPGHASRPPLTPHCSELHVMLNHQPRRQHFLFGLGQSKVTVGAGLQPLLPKLLLPKLNWAPFSKEEREVAADQGTHQTIAGCKLVYVTFKKRKERNLCIKTRK